jgi:twitching motility protein PilT
MALPTTQPEASIAPAGELAPAVPFPPRSSLRDILHTAVAHGASDVHIRTGAQPIIRVSGDLWPLDVPELTSAEAEELVLAAIPTERDRRLFLNEHECDFALTAEGIGRFRVNAYRTRGGAAMVLRHVKEDIPGFDELGLPSSAHDLALMPSGLILVCGPTGSGKTTTLAAMTDAINMERRCHILTIEDPIEYLHRNKLATISQRELHTDTLEFARALRSGMRQDPDVILVGEIRDAETMRTALQAAETGHLVMASLHARTVVDAVNRVIDIFPVAEQRQARASIAESLQGIVCQHLVQSTDGSGRTVVLEIAVATPRIRESIADVDKTHQLQDIVADGQYYGMRTFEQDAVRLVLSGTISVEEAEKVVPRAADLHVALRRAGYREQV